VLFFLKCMETTEADDRLLWLLIEREIKAREWFILCDSPNARNSAAVLREMELVKSLAREGKVVETIDLDRDFSSTNGAPTSQPRPTPWVSCPTNCSSPERAAQPTCTSPIRFAHGAFVT